ncbi:hypothetical protein [Mycobacterium sp. 236(2023)]|uniref:hypothetical protein n=1 Tax=Mycobacterium sp. 236(2023) TaxID=3038163 RepID=UPI002414EFC2|nr:hypothetical protein [Mycobacterium sp. 236(2023)]MDG4668032.1 hypothetical protein [Mycobacterium sp. 236(2023)]
MTAVLTPGADKGIGFETARQFTDRVHSGWIGARRGRFAADTIGGADNGGLSPHEPFGDDRLDRCSTGTVGVMRATRAVLPLQRASNKPGAAILGSFGWVTNLDKTELNSASGIHGTSKAAVPMLTLEYSTTEPAIKLTAVEPGRTNTDFNAAMPTSRSGTDSDRGVVGRVPLPTGTHVDDSETFPW